MGYRQISVFSIVHIILVCNVYAKSYQNYDLEAYINQNPESDLSIDLSECSNIPLQELKSVAAGRSSITSSAIEFWYRHVKISKSLPTVVFLPGGPGSGSMGDFDGYPSLVELINNSLANIILIDPLGVGCNWIDPKNNSDSIKLASTENTATQIVSLIRKENLKNYYIYGHSYGTVLGTILTSKLNDHKELMKPKKLILEGVMGSAKTIASDYYGLNEVTNVVIKYDPDLNYLVQNLDKFPVQFPYDFWGSILGTSSRIIIYPEENWKIKEIAAEFRSGNSISVENSEYLEKSYAFFTSYNLDMNLSLIEDYTYHSIWCTEFSDFGSNKFLITITDGVLILSEKHKFKNPCATFPSTKNLYDSKDFQLSVPLIYIQGDMDTSTPLASAQYHYKSQLASHNISFLRIESDGHLPTSNRLQACIENVWEEIFRENANFENVLNTSGHCK